MFQSDFDVVVIGAGSGGLSSAVGLAKIGKRVLLVEREHLGGECTNSGCIPSKALLHHAKTYHQAVAVAGKTPESETYRQNALRYVREKIEHILATETPAHFEKLGIQVVMGEAVFLTTHSLSVQGTTYTFKKAIVATGSSPRPLTVEGLNPAKVLTNQNLFALPTIPSRLLIVGAGPIGMEMGQAFAYLGSEVTILDNGPEFARLEEPAIRAVIKKVFTDEGITILQNAALKEVVGNEAVVEHLTKESEDPIMTHILFDNVLIAIGRVPNLPAGLPAASVSASEFGITVDSKWRTTNKDIYALGDVAARLKFTHVADDTARQVVTHIASKGLLRVTEKQVPKVTYTEPEIGQVGLSFEEATARFGADCLHRVEVPLRANDRAETDDATVGVLIVIAKRLTGKIVGAHMIGPRAGELIGTLTLAMEQNISLYKIRSTIFAYPTYSLLLKRAGDYFLAAQVASLKSDLIRVGKKALPKVIAVCVWITILLWLRDYQTTYGLTVSELSVRLFEFITSTVWGPLLYILAYTVRPLTFFPGTALTVLSGVFFGLWGILYTIIGANLSATLAYFVGRFFSTDLKHSTSLLKTWSEPLRTNPFVAILTMRLTFFPFDGVNYGAGLLRVPFLPYILATILGTLLGIATFVAIGAALSVEEFKATGITTDAIDSTFIILSLVIFIASLLIAKLLKK